MSSTSMEVDILLAIYNGETYLEELLESLFKQSHKDWRLLILDDGSKDRSLEIIKKYIDSYRDKIVFLNDQYERDSNQGACATFGELLQYSEAPFVAFCDQDDVWKQDKLECLLTLIKKEDEKLPLLVHSDLEVVDQNLKTMGASFWNFQNLDPLRNSSLSRLIVQNNITGAATLCNRALIEKSVPIPTEGVIMHDWWMGLVASAFGKILIEPKALVQYRQHESNDTGAKSWNWSYILNKMTSISEIRKSIELTRRQAHVFLNQFQDQLSAEKLKAVQGLIQLEKESLFQRLKIITENDLKKQGRIRQIAFALFS